MDFTSAATKDFLTMLFVAQMDNIMGTPNKHKWHEMNDGEKDKWRKFESGFEWGDEDPDWMEK